MGGYADAVLADSPLLYYRFENNTTNSGSLSPTHASSITYVAGKSGQAMQGAVNNHLTATTTNGYYDDGTFTISSWIKLPSTVTNDYNTITRRNSGSHYVLDRVRGTNLGLNPGRYEVFVQNTNGSMSLVSTQSVCDNTWHHVAVVANGTTFTLYVDGVFSASGSQTVAGFTISGPQYIGKAENNSEYFVGVLDEVAVFPTALTEARLLQHVQAMANDVPAAATPFIGWGIPAR